MMSKEVVEPWEGGMEVIINLAIYIFHNRSFKMFILPFQENKFFIYILEMCIFLAK